METEKNKIIRLTMPEPLNDEPGSTGVCSLCGKVGQLVEMRSLPEVEDHARQVGSCILAHKPFPDPPKDEDLMARYGYGFKDVFCEDCLKKVLAKVFVDDITKKEE